MHYRGSQTKKKFYKNLKLVFAQSDVVAVFIELPAANRSRLKI